MTACITCLFVSFVSFFALSANAQSHAVESPRPASVQSPANSVLAAYQAFLGRTPTDSEINHHLSSGLALPLIIQNIIQSKEAAERASTLPASELCSARARQIRVVGQVLAELRSQFHERMICVGYCHIRYRVNASHQIWSAPVVRGRGITEAAAISNLGAACANEANRLTQAAGPQASLISFGVSRSETTESASPSAQCLPL